MWKTQPRPRPGQLTMIAMLLISGACDDPPTHFTVDTDSADGGVDTDGDPAERPPTTLKETIVSVLPAEDLMGEQTDPDRTDWGITDIGPGEPFIPRNDMGIKGPTDSRQQQEVRRSIAYFLHVTDSQIIDEESPARLIQGDEMFDSAYRLQEAWSSHFLEATIRTGNDFAAVFPFDFALFTGDMIDNIHRNELSWFLQVMEGGLIDPDSGQDDDPRPGAENDPHDPFMAEGFARGIPWYSTIGNHDDLALGNGPLIDWMLADPTGDTTSELSNTVEPTCLAAPFFPTESPLPARCFLPPMAEYTSTAVIPDPERAFIARGDWLSAHFGTATVPDGHGYTQANLTDDSANYVVERPIPGVPLVVINVNLVAESGQWGVLDEAHRTWLISALEQAQATKRAVIVASHHTSNSINDEGQQAELIALLNAYPNVIAHIGGHTHRHRITPHPPPPTGTAEQGYWEIETASVIDWPQQSRIIEIVDNRNGTGDIYCTVIDYQIPQEMPVLEGGRFYALYDVQQGAGYNGAGEITDRNVVLRFAWPAEIAEQLAVLGKREIQSLKFETM